MASNSHGKFRLSKVAAKISSLTFGGNSQISSAGQVPTFSWESSAHGLQMPTDLPMKHSCNISMTKVVCELAHTANVFVDHGNEKRVVAGTLVTNALCGGPRNSMETAVVNCVEALKSYTSHRCHSLRRGRPTATHSH